MAYLLLVVVACDEFKRPGYLFTTGAVLIAIAYFVNLKNIFERMKVGPGELVFLPLLYVAVLALVWILVAAFVMLASPPYMHLEEGRLIFCSADAKIQDVLEMSAYFAIITLTTVGYGDCFPMSTDGRLGAGIAAFIGSVHSVAFLAILLIRWDRDKSKEAL